MTTTTPSIEPTIQEQASVVLAHAAGYASHRTVAIGLRSGLLEALAASEHATPDERARLPLAHAHACGDPRAQATLSQGRRCHRAGRDPRLARRVRGAYPGMLEDHPAWH
jgi:hypothetical protein